MDPLCLCRRPIFDQLEVLSMRRDLLSRMWPEESRVRAFVVEAVKAARTFSERDHRSSIALEFLGNVFALLRRPAEVADLSAGLPAKPDREWFLNQFVMSRMADGDVIAELVADRDTFARLPREGGWVGHALTRRVRILLEDQPGRKFEIEELAPLGVETDRFSARSLLCAALDEDRLTDSAVKRLLELFPEDSYLKGAMERRRQQ